MKFFPNLQPTFTRRVAYPGLAVLVGLSVICALFPRQTNACLASIQTLIYDKLSWAYTLMISFFFLSLISIMPPA